MHLQSGEGTLEMCFYLKVYRFSTTFSRKPELNSGFEVAEIVVVPVELSPSPPRRGLRFQADAPVERRELKGAFT